MVVTKSGQRARQTLIIIPCGQAKAWDKSPWLGAIPAAEAYTGAPFKVNKEYAEKFADKWVIFSAKYGFIEPDFKIPEAYNVTFKKKSTGPIDKLTLQRQAERLGLYEFSQIVGLGGKAYQAVVKDVFSGKPAVRLSFPFAGLPLGLAMQAIKREIAAREAND